MFRSIFYRNNRSRDQLELFLISAVASLLLVRFYLHLTNYPQIGNSSLHIAHMLWGGGLMLGALVICLSFLGARVQRFAAFIGGVGFGVFIDEIGKFITSDNNYFYQPAIGIIYAIFIILYLLFNFLSRVRPLTSREYQLNALAQLEEAIVQDMSNIEKHRVQDLLNHADSGDPLTQRLQHMLDSVNTIKSTPQPNRIQRLRRQIDHVYERFWHQRNSSHLLQAFFVAEAGIFMVAVIAATYGSLNDIRGLLDGSLTHAAELAIGQVIASCVAAGFVLWGVIVLPRSRMRAYEQFRRSALVNLFLTQFFMFARTEFDALPGFFFNLAILGLVGYAMHQEQRLSANSAR